MRVDTTCIYCGTGCLLKLKIRNGRVFGTLPHEKGPGLGRLCIKGWSAHEFIHHPDRLKSPLLKRKGEFKKITWKEAIKQVVNKINFSKKQYGDHSVAFLSSAKTTNEENYLFQKLARAVVGTNNVDHCARLCHASTITGLVSSFGSGAMTNSQEDLEESDAIFVIGSNTSEQHPLIARRMIRSVKRGTKLIVADPRAIKLTEYATIYLPHRSGTDVALLNAMMNVILQRGLHDHEFIQSKTEGFHKFKEVIKNYSPEQVENITGVSAEDIIKAAIILGEAKKASIFFSMGITQHTTGVDNVVSVANLAMLTGNIGRIGTGVNPLRGQNNVQGACDMGGLPDYLPGYNKVTDQETRNFFEEAWGVKLSANPGKTLMEIMDSCGEEIRTMFIMGENPLLSDPDIKHVREQLEKLDFLIVSELFMSETAELADLVLPAASFAEKNGTYTATDRRVQRIRKAIEPIGDSLPDWQIISRISRELGYNMCYESSSEIMDEIASVAKIYGGISYSRLEKEDLRWPCTDVQHVGTKILHVDKFSRGFGRFHSVEYKPPNEETDAEYPLLLTTGRLLPHWHTGTMTRRSKTLTDQLNKATVEINSKDAKILNICSGDIVKVRSRRGEITLEAYVTDGIKKGIVFISFHFAEAAANILTNPALDPLAKIPELKVCAVSIHKLKQ